MKWIKKDKSGQEGTGGELSAIEQKMQSFKSRGFHVPSRKLLKTPEQIEGIRRSSAINTAVLDLVAGHIHEGMTTEEIDKLVYNYTVAHGAIPAPLNFEGFPKSVCTSVNDEVCHGIPSEQTVLRRGDIVNVDVSTILDGYFSDASRMFMIGEVAPEAKRLVEVAHECLDLGLKAAKPWGCLGDVGAAVQAHAEKNGYSVVREFGGHGVGLKFHEEPFVSHVGRPGTGILLVPGMVFTIEPMINLGKRRIYIDEENGWTVLTDDGQLSAQWEYTVLITETGTEVLTH
ncbi:MAG: type I methionyl aminopeptidase [Odoribacter splanchnicus]|nr:type I methionyl aminopeptidase [Odoribacter splanchnicus]